MTPTWRHPLVIAGFLATVLYSLVAAVLVGSSDSLTALKLNEVGELVAGVLGPPALAWVVIGVIIQSQELSSNTRALQAQADATRAITDLENKKLTLELFRIQSEARRSRSQYVPYLDFDDEVFFDEQHHGLIEFTRDALNLQIRNYGTEATLIATCDDSITGVPRLTAKISDPVDFFDTPSFEEQTARTVLPANGLFNLAIRLDCESVEYHRSNPDKEQLYQGYIRFELATVSGDELHQELRYRVVLSGSLMMRGFRLGMRHGNNQRTVYTAMESEYLKLFRFLPPRAPGERQMPKYGKA